MPQTISKGIHAAIARINEDRNAPNEAWMIAEVIGNGERFDLYAEGTGVDSFKETLPDDNVCFCLITFRVNVDGAETNRVLFIHWKGSKCRGMKIVRSNQLTQMAWDLMKSHGHIEVTNKDDLSDAMILTKWDPKAGSHQI